MSSLSCFCCKKEERTSGWFTAINSEVDFHRRCGCFQGTLAVSAFALFVAGLALLGLCEDKTVAYVVTFSGVGMFVALLFVLVYMNNCYRPFSSSSWC